MPRFRAHLVTVVFALAVAAGCGQEDAAPTPQATPAESSGRNAPPPAPTPWNDPEVIAGVATPSAGENEIRSRLAAYNVRHDLMDDPDRDGWNTETLSSAAHRQLDQLLHAMLADTADTALVATLVADDIVIMPLRPARADLVFGDSSIRVHREAIDDSGDVVGRVGLAAVPVAFAELLPKSAAGSSLHSKVKTWGVTLEGNDLQTRHYLNIHNESGYEQNSLWLCGWQVDAAGALKLTTLTSKEFEEVQTDAPDGRLFADCTRAVLGKTANFEEQILPGIHKWLRNIDISVDPDFEGMQGIAIGDVNGDGLDDLYACQGGGLPNRLYLQNVDGTLRDASAASGADWIETTRSALLVDLDNDGDQDLILAPDGMLLIMANDGQAHFTEVARFPDITLAFSLAAADYDSDGDLDIYATRHFSEAHKAVGQLPNPVPYHDANNGGRNVLLRNDGNWSFADVTVEVGLDDNNRRWSYAAAWDDFDKDGDLDLYVSNDFGRNNLYRNDNGRFRDVAASAGVEDIASGMSVSWGDYDGDGWSDLYVSNMFSAAGSRITFQEQFKGDASSETRTHYQRLARGNTLFRNLGDGTFEDVSVAAGVTMGRWSWGSLFVDINNDGMQDIIVGNGYVTGDDSGDL